MMDTDEETRLRQRLDARAWASAVRGAMNTTAAYGAAAEGRSSSANTDASPPLPPRVKFEQLADLQQQAAELLKANEEDSVLEEREFADMLELSSTLRRFLSRLKPVKAVFDGWYATPPPPPPPDPVASLCSPLVVHP